MTSAETEIKTGYASGDEEWLYGDGEDLADAEGEDEEKAETEVFSALVGDVEGITEVENQDATAESDSDSDDNVRVTIGNIKSSGSQNTNTPISLDIKTSGKATAADAAGSISSTPEVDVEPHEEKPWRKPGADLSDYFNYGFNEDTWKTYCDRQRRLRMSLEVLTLSSASKNLVSWGDLTIKAESSSRRSNSSIEVIEGQMETISRVEGRRRRSTDEENTQTASENSSATDQNSSKPPPIFPSNIPPPPFPLLSISTTPPLIQPPPLGIPGEVTMATLLCRTPFLQVHFHHSWVVFPPGQAWFTAPSHGSISPPKTKRERETRTERGPEIETGTESGAKSGIGSVTGIERGTENGTENMRENARENARGNESTRPHVRATVVMKSAFRGTGTRVTWRKRDIGSAPVERETEETGIGIEDTGTGVNGTDLHTVAAVGEDMPVMTERATGGTVTNAPNIAETEQNPARSAVPSAALNATTNQRPLSNHLARNYFALTERGHGSVILILFLSEVT
ncbi:pre-mRNA 3'-end-processing factor FIP1 isoform X4 [Trichomycterus rosablanca]|uniref:pre-mRNA 3'-end-processing factor FIP1 isoform X4 n=1 Tax=Trichomycterus rosablanca TaxID=2290929 RepID=UPI002F360229